MATPIISPPLLTQTKIAYRSDTRPPEVIFREGFNRRMGVYQQEFARYIFNGNIGNPVFQDPLTAPEYRDQNYMTTKQINKLPIFDINPSTAISLTFRHDLACIFPLSSTQVKNEPTWLYAVRLDEFYATYQLQQQDKPEFASLEEVAAATVPACDVIGGIRCIRYGNPWPAKMKYVVLPGFTWNPGTSYFALRPIMERAFLPHLNRLTIIETDGAQITSEIRKNELTDKSGSDLELMFQNGQGFQYVSKNNSVSMKEQLRRARLLGTHSYTTDDIPQQPNENEPLVRRPRSHRYREI